MNVTYLCRKDANAHRPCISQACPIIFEHAKPKLARNASALNSNGVTTAEACHALCDRHDACGSLMYNGYSSCYLRASLGVVQLAYSSRVVRVDEPRHGTVLCEKIVDEASTARAHSMMAFFPGRLWLVREAVRPLSVDLLYELQMLASTPPDKAAKRDQLSKKREARPVAKWDASAQEACREVLYGTNVTSSSISSSMPSITPHADLTRAPLVAADIATLLAGLRGPGHTQPPLTPVINMGMIKTGTTSLHSALQRSNIAGCKWSSSVRSPRYCPWSMCRLLLILLPLIVAGAHR